MHFLRGGEVLWISFGTFTLNKSWKRDILAHVTMYRPELCFGLSFPGVFQLLKQTYTHTEEGNVRRYFSSLWLVLSSRKIFSFLRRALHITTYCLYCRLACLYAFCTIRHTRFPFRKSRHTVGCHHCL